MKKLVVKMLVLLSSGTVCALPFGNPSEASLYLHGVWFDYTSCNPCSPCFNWCDAWSVRFGYYGDYVFNRHMQVGSDDNGSGGDIKQTEVYTSAAYLVFNLCDRLDFFGTLGATNIYMRTDVNSFANLSFVGDFKFTPDFSWSFGTRATIWSCDCLTVGFEAQYFSTTPAFSHFLRGDTGTYVYFDDNNHSKYWEWQAGLGASYRFATRCPTIAMVPYVGIKWSRSHFTHDKFTFDDGGTTFVLHGMRSKKLWGYAIGTSLTLCDMVGVTVEGRWADEKAVYVNGEFRF